MALPCRPLKALPRAAENLSMPSTPLPPTAQDIYRCLREVVRAFAPLPRQPLQPAARRALAGHVHPEVPLAVREAARALREHPDLFPDVPLDAEALLEVQDRAHAWSVLAEALERYAALARDAFLRDQGEAGWALRALLRQVRADRQRPFPQASAQQREQALLCVEQVLARCTHRR